MTATPPTGTRPTGCASRRRGALVGQPGPRRLGRARPSRLRRPHAPPTAGPHHDPDHENNRAPMTIASQPHTEIHLINRTWPPSPSTLAPALAGPSSLAPPTLPTACAPAAASPIDAVERRLPELSSASRPPRPPHFVRLRACPRPRSAPPGAPAIDWRAATLRRPRHTMLAGRNYSAQPCRRSSLVRLRTTSRTPHRRHHGSGKSTLARMLALSLALNTAGTSFAMVPVDMKKTATWRRWPPCPTSTRSPSSTTTPPPPLQRRG